MNRLFRRLRLLSGLTFCLAATASLQAQDSSERLNWRAVHTTGGPARDNFGLMPPAGGTHGVIAVSNTESVGSATLPNDHGQIWKQYDIRRFTERSTGLAKPEQAIIDWILRETGTEVWFSEPLGLLSANRLTLTAYHTPEIQAAVNDVVDRFVGPDTEKYVFGVRMVTIGNPNWRTKALPRIRSVTVESPGVEAWLMSSEDAAVVMDDLRRRTDYREYNSPNLLIRNGQSHQVERKRPLAYVKTIRRAPEALGGYRMEMGQLEEGFSLTLHPLLAQDRRTVDAVLKVESSQVEKMTPTSVQTPSVANPRQMSQIQVPQTSSWRLHERFRWPADEVLLISCGVVASPGPERGAGVSIPPVLSQTPARADALVFVESKGRVNSPLDAPATEARLEGLNYRGRY